MSEPALKWKNNASFKENYTLDLIVAFKMAYSCCSGLRSKLDFPEILQKSFITSTTGLTLAQNLWSFAFCAKGTRRRELFKCD